MDRKKFLSGAVIVISSFGVIAALTPFSKSLKPNAKAEAALERLDTSTLESGKSMIVGPHPLYGNLHFGYDWSLLIYKKYNGEIKIWDIPTKGLNVGMPDIKWYRPWFPCEHFGPTKVSGKVDESQPIKCHDLKSKDSWYPDMQWDINGKNIKGHASDMYPTRGVIEGKYFVFGKSS